MKTTKLFTIMLALSLIGFVITSCKKAEKDDVNDTTVASDNEQQETISNDASNIADNAVKLGANGASRMSGTDNVYDALSLCATVTRDTVAVPHVMIIDFGTTNCTCRDGRTRRGKIIVTYTGGYFETGSVKTMTFDNYYHNDNKVEGTRTITNMGANTDGHLYWTVKADMKITKTDGRTHTWKADRVRTMVAGQDTPDWSDDVYEVTGSNTGTNAKGINYTANITKALHRALSCKWIESGTIEITPEGKAVRTVDFGNGNCDDQATVSLRKQTRTITLH